MKSRFSVRNTAVVSRSSAPDVRVLRVALPYDLENGRGVCCAGLEKLALHNRNFRLALVSDLRS